MLDKKLFVEAMTGFSEIYGKPLSDIAMKMYYTALEGMTDEQFKQAVDIVIQTHKFAALPKPAEFMEAIKGDKVALTIKAWQKIETTMARVGAYQTIIFDDPLIHGFIQSFEGGWPGLCAKTLDELIWVRKDFERYYQAMGAEGITCKPLIGISEGENITTGHPHERLPYYIGDKAKGEALIEHEPVTKLIDGIAKGMEG